MKGMTSLVALAALVQLACVERRYHCDIEMSGGAKSCMFIEGSDLADATARCEQGFSTSTACCCRETPSTAESPAVDACGTCTRSTGGTGTTAQTCTWSGCSQPAPAGSYQCSGETIVQCVNGAWKTVVGCLGLQNSRGYSCTRKGGCGTSTVECSYAFDVCGGQEYPTCGPGKTVSTVGGWSCK